MLHRIGAALVVLLALACGSPQAWAGKEGPEFRVNTFTVNHQLSPSVARLSNGGFVVTWYSLFQDGSGSGVYGQLYRAKGGKFLPEFRVNTHTTGDQALPSVAGLSGGGFVVIWQSVSQDGSGWGVYGQRFSAARELVGSEFRVNTHTPGQQWLASVAGLSDGGFVVTWTSSYSQDGSGSGVYGQLYSAAGAPVGSEFRVNTYTTFNQDSPSIAGLSDGGFVVTWRSDRQDGSGDGVFGQRYSAAGGVVGGEFRVNTTTANGQWAPSVAGLGNGGFVVTWTSCCQDGSSVGVYGQRYSAAGAPLGSEFRVNKTTAGQQWQPSVAALSDGDFVVTWQSADQDGSGYGVYGKRYSATGTLVASEFRANTYTADDQDSPSVAALSDGGFVVTWQSLNQDGSIYGVYGQRFSADAAPKITLDPVSQTVRSGQTVTFTADASGRPTPTVQWQLSMSGGGRFANIVGATAKTLSFATTSRQSGNQYRAVFSNSLGTATTKAATLTVRLFR